MPQQIEKDIILAMLTGLTLIFPVSSSAHLVIYGKILGNELPFDRIMLFHLGSFLAILIYFWRDCVRLVTGQLGWNVVRFFGLSFVATSLVGLALEELVVPGLLAEPKLVSLLLVITALFLWGVSYLSGRGAREFRQLSLKEFLLIGAVQGLAAPPGISRLGITLGSALLRGLKWSDAVKLSFLLSLPTIFAANVFEFTKLLVGHWSLDSLTGATLFSTSIDWLQIALNVLLVLVALATSLLALNFLSRYVYFGRRLLFHFGLYCAVTGLFFYLFLQLI